MCSTYFVLDIIGNPEMTYRMQEDTHRVCTILNCFVQKRQEYSQISISATILGTDPPPPPIDTKKQLYMLKAN